MLTAIWTAMTTGQPYTDLGGDYYTRRRPGHIITKAVNQLKAAGLTVTFTDPHTATVT
jgi:hypothetical protein